MVKDISFEHIITINVRDLIDLCVNHMNEDEAFDFITTLELEYADSSLLEKLYNHFQMLVKEYESENK